jgi:hypothetical protein
MTEQIKTKELVEWLRSQSKNGMNCVPGRHSISMLDAISARLTKLEKDRERLDWFRVNSPWLAEYLFSIGWKSPNDAQWDKLDKLTADIRLTAMLYAASSSNNRRPVWQNGRTR